MNKEDKNSGIFFILGFGVCAAVSSFCWILNMPVWAITTTELGGFACISVIHLLLGGFGMGDVK
ncbi:MAG: hypothetical protein MUO73_01990 [Thermoplasmata archaeon]|nr:hypothetical protein [Thermoplasmata archaeon]